MNQRLYSDVSDRELLNLTLLAAKREKEATFALLDYLLEVDVRRLYATKVYSSLFEYIVKELGLSEPAAAERVNAVKTHLKEGRLSLTTASQIERFIKTENKVRADRVPVSEKTTIIDACLDHSKREVEKKLLGIQTEGAKILTQERIKPMAEDRIELKLSINLKAFQKLEKLKELTGETSLEAIFSEGLDLLVLKEQKKRGHDCKPTLSTLPAEPEKVTNLNSRFIPIDLKRAIFARSGGQCEYRDPKTKRRCECRYRIQVDHIYPYALGGKTELTNLRHLCQTHNLHAAKRWGLNDLSSIAPIHSHQSWKVN